MKVKTVQGKVNREGRDCRSIERNFHLVLGTEWKKKKIGGVTDKCKSRLQIN